MSKMESLKLKLAVDKKDERVLFAEAGKEFVDFIFHILSLPLGTVTRILSGAGADEAHNNTTPPGSLVRLYRSIENLDDTQIDPIKKECLLKAKAPFWGSTSFGLLPGASLPGVRNLFPSQSYNFSWADMLAAKGCDDGGYVKAQLYMVTDDLVVKPMSAMCALSLMGPKDRVSDFENKEVHFGPDEALKLLKASLWSKTVLTGVFLIGAA